MSANVSGMKGIGTYIFSSHHQERCDNFVQEYSGVQEAKSTCGFCVPNLGSSNRLNLGMASTHILDLHGTLSHKLISLSSCNRLFLQNKKTKKLTKVETNQT